MSSQLPAIRFKQWLPEWDRFDFDQSQHRRKPDDHILLFSMPAVQLRALSGVYRRTRGNEGSEGLQRLHDPKRSVAIRDFVRNGHPYSSLPSTARDERSLALRKPGWLPTAIVVNILTPQDKRRERQVAAEDLVKVTVSSNSEATLSLPYENRLDQWSPKSLEPFEVIDGQHRLWAFDDSIIDQSLPGDFELPVVAFTGLDIGWQAYLFWSINVSPKRINPSHAFDLFPLLRSAEWLETFSDLKIYRQARAQELTEFLFTQPESPFYNRINMLGEGAKTAPPGAGVTQAGWVQAITTSLLSPGGSRATKGLFAAEISPTHGPLEWSRPHQAAFLIILWNEIKGYVQIGDELWIREITAPNGQQNIDGNNDAAFIGTRTMLNQEQGVRGVIAVTNDIFFSLAQSNVEIFHLESTLLPGTSTTSGDIATAISEIESSGLFPLIREIAIGISSFDWRSADAPGLGNADRLLKRAFRGSSGYVALRQQLFLHLANKGGTLAPIAQECERRLV